MPQVVFGWNSFGGLCSSGRFWGVWGKIGYFEPWAESVSQGSYGLFNVQLGRQALEVGACSIIAVFPFLPLLSSRDWFPPGSLNSGPLLVVGQPSFVMSLSNMAAKKRV